MAYQLVGRIGGRPVRLVLPEGESVLGSGSDCQVKLEHPSVSRSHARFVVQDDRIEIQDLGSRNGTFLAGQRIAQQHAELGSTITFGQASFVLERVGEGDLEAALVLPASEPESAPTEERSGYSTIRTKPAETFALEKLPPLLGLLSSGGDRTRLAQAGGAALFETLLVLAVEVTTGSGDSGILFEARRDSEGIEGATTVAGGGDLWLRVTFAQASQCVTFQPLLESVSSLIRLAAAPGGATPKPSSPPPPLPDPPSVVPEVQRIYAEAARIARGDVGVLICGESGTGKEVLARYIHAASLRSAGPFVALNCAALPRDLLESELFGIERGVATGVDARAGKFELAHGGTLFLDEIGDMALETQARILRVLQEGEVHRIGGVASRHASVRVVAATHRDLERLQSEGRFREDLYYRIATWTVQLPPLRRRLADLPNLAAHFLAREAARTGIRAKGISRSALERLTAYEWPGNIRQLEKEMARAVLFLEDGDLLDSARLGSALQQQASSPGTRGPTRLADTLERVERDEILATLKACSGDVAQAADALGLGRSTLYRRMKALGIEVPPD
jgi:transcriptional regulator with AAA-type ATPase domain